MSIEKMADVLSDEYTPEFDVEQEIRWDLEAQRDSLRLQLRDCPEAHQAGLVVQIILIDLMLG